MKKDTNRAVKRGKKRTNLKHGVCSYHGKANIIDSELNRNVD